MPEQPMTLVAKEQQWDEHCTAKHDHLKIKTAVFCYSLDARCWEAVKEDSSVGKRNAYSNYEFPRQCCKKARLM